MPPKIKHFWWRIYHKAAPIAKRLKRRVVRMDSICQMCRDHEETINHVLFQCRVSKEICEHSPDCQMPGNQVSANDLNRNIEELMKLNKTTISICLLYRFIGWRIWKMRNNIIFSGKIELIPDTINKVIMDNQQWV